MPAAALPGFEKVAVDFEVALKDTSTAAFNDVKAAVLRHCTDGTMRLRDGPLQLPQDPFLDEHVAEAHICVDPAISPIRLGRTVFHWELDIQNVSVFQLSEDPPADDDAAEGEACAFKEWTLPSRHFHQLWEHLIFDSEVKSRLLQYAESALIFADHKIDRNIISWNRVVLLHGPPGTGKTSLIKALAQKLAVRLNNRYESAQLIEIDAHSLFSKWFSESGKLVSKLFAKIGDMLEGGDSLVFVLIDEVESLAAARQSGSSSEPADAVRAVNALLTQLDGLKTHSNVMVLTTSNLTDAVDSAFLDRADIKALIGLPSTQARYEILRSCLAELARVGIICSDFAPQPWTEFQASSSSIRDDELQQRHWALCQSLFEVALKCEGLSGRTLRKLPLLAFRSDHQRRGKLSCQTYIQLLDRAVESELADRRTCKVAGA